MLRKKLQISTIHKLKTIQKVLIATFYPTINNRHHLHIMVLKIYAFNFFIKMGPFVWEVPEELIRIVAVLIQPQIILKHEQVPYFMTLCLMVLKRIQTRRAVVTKSIFLRWIEFFFDRSGFLITHKTTKICANTKGIHHTWEHFLSLKIKIYKRYCLFLKNTASFVFQKLSLTYSPCILSGYEAFFSKNK